MEKLKWFFIKIYGGNKEKVLLDSDVRHITESDVPSAVEFLKPKNNFTLEVYIFELRDSGKSVNRNDLIKKANA